MATAYWAGMTTTGRGEQMVYFGGMHRKTGDTRHFTGVSPKLIANVVPVSEACETVVRYWEQVLPVVSFPPAARVMLLTRDPPVPNDVHLAPRWATDGMRPSIFGKTLLQISGEQDDECHTCSQNKLYTYGCVFFGWMCCGAQL